ncbi:glycosyltransferase family 39 protein [Streptomyces sp. B1866]|uniref:ArnT family glycosyltransferase n=1 Tax=Streptomyces sp. B1866 TaxID=3075431 RepID=UPI00288FE54E|nr:glycosyltransferase family 39 protein [Streptomyces sp. B1866]MDT3396474.1 glycosyltransferase family 39 protein [Streptomyces sp. B1866]
MWALLAATAALYLWTLDESAYGNKFYAAAAQAGSESWKAFFFGSSDAANSITVDKPPASLWPMGLSVRLFGLGSWQVMVPQALIGVATVAVLYAAVRRRSGAVAGLVAGGVLALTPVAALMFRYDNPDALLCLLSVAAVSFTLRALEDARTRWLLLAGACLGFGFLTKTLQAWLIVPAIAVGYAVCAPTPLARRLWQLLAAGAAMAVAGGWWVAAVELWPKSSRPYVGGSEHNSFLELTFGYNGLGRINGDENGTTGSRQQWGSTGLGRLFGTDMGGQIAWLLPAALVLLAAGLWVTWRAARTDARRAAFLVWGGSLLTTFLIFSFMSGIFHEYYNIALAPYIAALVGMGSVALWERRASPVAVAVAVVTVAGTAVWSYTLLNRSAGWLPWLRWAVLVGALVAAVGLLAAALASRARGGGPDGAPADSLAGTPVGSPRAADGSADGASDGASGGASDGFSGAAPAGAVRPAGGPYGRLALGAAGLGLAAALAGPLAYTLNTVNTGHHGAIVIAGPPVKGMPALAGVTRGGRAGAAGGAGAAGAPGAGGAGAPGQAHGTGQGAGAGAGVDTRVPGGNPAAQAAGLLALVEGLEPGHRVTALLARDADRYRWTAATVTSNVAASYQLAARKPVMAVGGFHGSDPSPTLARFQEYARQGRIHYFIAPAGLTTGSLTGGPGGGAAGAGGQAGAGARAAADRLRKNTAFRITAWVEQTFAKTTVDGTVLYDLTRPKPTG